MMRMRWQGGQEHTGPTACQRRSACGGDTVRERRLRNGQTPGETRTTSGQAQSFFFHAEDGIRYGTVTGVQTCALPIFLPRKPRQLSGGQRQRVAMGRAIVREPAVFLFDEPLSNLDAKLRVQMRAELQGLHRRLGTTSLYVTHDQVEAMTLANRMIVMNAGRAEQIGAPLEVYAKPATTFVASFIGSPPMNIIPQQRNGRPVLFGIRPEHLEPCAPAEALLTPEVDLIEPLGADTLVYGRLANGARVGARLHSSMQAGIG